MTELAPVIGDLDAATWGTASSWVFGLVTSIAVLVAALTYRANSKDRRRAQARLVGAWLAHPKSGRQEEFAGLVIRNGSSEPVYDCTVRLLRWEWRQRREVVASRSFPLLVPDDSTDPERTSIGPIASPPQGTLNTHPPLEIEFVDAQEIRWVRHPDGRLEEQEEVR